MRWRHDAERRVIAVIGAEAHRRARNSGAADMCNALADLADDLIAAKKAALKAVERSAAPWFGAVGSPRLARFIAARFAQYVTAVPAAKVNALVAALRAYGVLICVIGDRDLERCRCLRSMAVSEIDARIRSEVRDVVGRGLERLEREASPFV